MSATTSITVRVPLKVRRRPGRKTVVMPVPAASVATRAEPALVKALARAFRYQKLLNDGRYASITDMAEWEKIDRGYLGRLLRLAVLAPDIVEALLDGRQEADTDLARLMKPLPSEWSKQRQKLASLEGAKLPMYPHGRDSTRDEDCRESSRFRSGNFPENGGEGQRQEASSRHRCNRAASLT